MEKDPTQSTGRYLKILIWILVIPSFLISVFFLMMTIQNVRYSSRLKVPVAHPIRMLGEPIPQRYSEISEVSLLPEGATKTGGSQIITLRLINPSSFPVVYVARSQSNPFHMLMKKEGGRWVNHDINWFVCGNSRQESVVINPLKSILISAKVDNDLFPVRIGIKHAHGETREQEVWSAPIEPNNNME